MGIFSFGTIGLHAEFARWLRSNVKLLYWCPLSIGTLEFPGILYVLDILLHLRFLHECSPSKRFERLPRNRAAPHRDSDTVLRDDVLEPHAHRNANLIDPQLLWYSDHALKGFVPNQLETTNSNRLCLLCIALDLHAQYRFADSNLPHCRKC